MYHLFRPFKSPGRRADEVPRRLPADPAATWIAGFLHRHPWIGYVGLAIVLYVALHMVWEGHRSLVVDLGQAGAYNAALLAIPIGAAELTRLVHHR